MRVAPVTLASASLLVDDVITAGQQLNQAFGYSVQVTIDNNGGAATGMLKLQGSLDDETYIDLTGSSFSVVDDTPVLYNVTDCMYPWVRVNYVDSGSDAGATMTIKFFYRGF